MRLIINGGNVLNGEVKVHGAKNSVLPILAALILNKSKEPVYIKELPELSDVSVMLRLLSSIGVKIRPEGKGYFFDTSNTLKSTIPAHLMKEMRSSIFLMGPLLGRNGEVVLAKAGGCAIGPRPIDLHIKGLKALGAEVEEVNNNVVARASQLIGTKIHLDFPSVGATENLMMAAVCAIGETTMYNVAKEPEIIDLQNFLNNMGAEIKGAGTDRIRIKGQCELKGISYKIIPDRIIAGTYMLTAATTGSKMKINNVIPSHLEALTAKLREAGVTVEENGSYVVVDGGNYNSIETVRTLPYPGFPTDLQAPMMTFLATAKGESKIIENVFEDRFQHVKYLNKMGADIQTEGKVAYIKGVSELSGAIVKATDLRAASALVIAGLAAQGQTVIEEAYHLFRGYADFIENLSHLGAEIRVEEKSNDLRAQ